MNGGTEMDVREKLIELLKQIKYVSVENAANILIDNGVTVQERGHWVPLTDCLNAGVYCSVCNKRVYKEDYAYGNRKNKLRSNYCPHCGAKMIPQPPKGEWRKFL